MKILNIKKTKIIWRGVNASNRRFASHETPKIKMNYYTDPENQRKVMEELYFQLQLTSLEDWNQVKLETIKKFEGTSFLRYYAYNRTKLLEKIYPNFPWETTTESHHSQEFFQNRENEIRYMDELYSKLKLKSMEEWQRVPKYQIKRNSGKYLLVKYSGEMEKLLAGVYPNYPWDFKRKINPNEYFKSKENQISFMNNLYQKFELKGLDDWLRVSKNSIIKNGGQSLLNQYGNNMNALLSSIYTYHHWSFVPTKPRSNEYFKSIENQHKFMDDLFVKFRLKTLEDWIQITRNQIIVNGGKSLVLYYYSNDLKKLLTSLYPNYPWYFEDLNESHIAGYFDSLENQQLFMNKLYKDFELKSLDDWLHIPKYQIIRNGGERLLVYRYSNDLEALLVSVYPNYPWQFDSLLSINPNHFFKSLSNQQKFMDQLFREFQLKSLDDWLHISRKKIIKYGGQSLILTYYSNDLKKLLSTVYPHYPWQFESIKINSNEYFKNIDNQRKFMQKLFQKYKLKTLDDWLSFPKTNIEKNGGHSLLSFYYAYDMKKLLSTLYPYYPWSFEILGDIQSTDTQKIIMENISKKLKLSSLRDWLRVSRNRFLLHGGKKILQYYCNDIKALLSSIYSHVDWQFDRHRLKFRPHKQYSKSDEFLLQKIRYLMSKYSIREKRDWYRLPSKLEKIEIYYILKSYFPHERWDRKFFNSRCKKATQRLLHIEIQRIFPSHLLIENYRHPYLLYFHSVPLEFDVFVPSLNFAFEYQGEQHYDDLPARFSAIEANQSRDQLKKSLALSHSLRLIAIPYWWNLSLSSLLSTIHHHSSSV